MKKYLISAGVVLVAGLLLIVGLHSSSPAPVSQNQDLGAANGDVRNGGMQFPNGYSSGAPRPTTESWAGDQIIARGNTASWTNTTGGTVYVDQVELSTNGTASSTYLAYVYSTTTAPRTLYDFVAPAGNSGTRMLINGTIIATSTAATSTTNIGSTLPPIIPVPNGTKINFLLTQRYTTPCNGSQCETATSTNRGFNMNWRLHWHD